MSPATRTGGWAGALLVGGLVLAADQLTKALVTARIEPGERVEVLPFLDLVHVLNRGVAFGFLGGEGKAPVLVLTLLALALVVGWFALEPRRPAAWLAVGLIGGGALGNLVDRVREDAVTDFIDLPAWPSFNLADIAITLGAAGLVLVALAGARGDPDDGG